ncbi:MAG: hypothetical protein M1812_000593 [Candelaria pacifica]|nr:MAG: hypothetical protein M1812_000593 [Candelaria pacifica]
MKLILALPLLLATLSVATAVPGLSERETACIATGSCDIFKPAPAKACSGDRKESDVCEGKKLRKQNSFHNCSNQDGKCCAKEKDGSGGQPATGNGEDCGYCFSGKCKG